jgi:hypothetical protein
MFHYVIRWKDPNRNPVTVLADRYAEEGDEFVFYSMSRDGVEERTTYSQREVDAVKQP